MIKRRWAALVVSANVLASVLTVSNVTHASGITKCKDENGKWHYGDYAAQACTRSKITTINEQGVKVKEQDAAMSREEMRALREAKERKKKAEEDLAAKRARDRRLLMTYESVASIEEARDARVEAVDRYLRSDQEFLKRLEDQLVNIHSRLSRSPNNQNIKDDIATTEEQIAAYEKAIAKRQAERKGIVDEFNEEIVRFQEIKQSQVTADTETLN